MPIADGLEGEVTHDSPLVTALDRRTRRKPLALDLVITNIF